MRTLVPLFLIFIQLIFVFCENPSVINVRSGTIPLSKNVVVKCPSSKKYAALKVMVDSDLAYYGCFDPIQKTPIFTVHEIKFTNSEDLSRPEVEPWYLYNDDRRYGNGRAITGGYDRGHLTPSADFERTTTDLMSSTFYIFNRAAQVGTFNRNSWRVLETITRNWVQKIESTCSRCNVKILTGTTTKSIGVTKEVSGVSLPIPKYYYKIVMVFNGAQSYAVLFFGSNNIRLKSFPITIIGSSEDVAKIPPEIEQDLSNVLGIANILYKKSNGLLRSNGKTKLFNQIPDAEEKLSK